MIDVPMTDTQFAATTRRLADNGITLNGSSGTLSKDGITARYEHTGERLRVTILEKPFLMPESLIEGRLKAFLDQSLAAG